MARHAKDPQIPLIDATAIGQILDDARARYNLTSDEQLAELLGVSDQAIYRWRRSIIDRSALALVTLLRENCSTAA